jgi:hypothetical protein
MAINFEKIKERKMSFMRKERSEEKELKFAESQQTTAISHTISRLKPPTLRRDGS